MKNSRSSYVVMTCIAIAAAVSISGASAATWHSNGNALDRIDTGFDAPRKKDGVSYVDDGFRAPLPGTMASRLLNAPDWTPAGTAAANPNKGRSVAAAARDGGAPWSNGNGGNAGRGAGSSAGVGSGIGSGSGSSAPNDAVLDTTPRTDGPTLGHGNGVPIPKPTPTGPAPVTGSGDDTAFITPVPLPASAVLLIAGLGALVPLSRRKRG